MSKKMSLNIVKKDRFNHIVQSISTIVQNKDKDIATRTKYEKIKKVLGISDEEIAEFANFQKNEKKLLNVLGYFIQHGRPMDSMPKIHIDDDEEEEEKDKKVKSKLGISRSSLDAYRNYKNTPKLEKMMGEFIELDDQSQMAKLDKVERIVEVETSDAN